MKKKDLYTLSLFTLLIIGVIYLVNYLGSITIENPDTNLAARNIETPAKLWLNGYLGMFFGFKYLGNINWLLLPLFGSYLYKKEFKLSRENWALISFFALAFILISLKGFFNFRYAFTLLSFCVFMVYFLLHKLFYQHSRALFYSLSAILLICIFYGFGKQMLSDRARAKIQEVLFAEPAYADVEVEEETALVVDTLFTAMSGINTNVVLVNNLPDFYYLSDYKGLYYWSGDDLYYDENGRGKLFEERATAEVKRFLKEHNCTHIYTHATYVGYNDDFDDFLKNDCMMEIEDLSGRQLYRVLYD